MKLLSNGLHFFGMVKTAHKEFPKKCFQSLPNLERTGMFVYLTATKNDFPLIACNWWGKRVKFIISTAGTNTVAKPHQRLRYRMLADGQCESFYKNTITSAVPFEYFSYAQKIDVHNHRRQGILALERIIHTKDWSFRIICTALGMILVDAYMMYLHECKLNNIQKPTECDSFVWDIAFQLSKGILADEISLRKRNFSKVEPVSNPDNAPELCVLTSLTSVADMTHRKDRYPQLKCSYCKDKCSFVCAKCSVSLKVVPICGPLARNHMSCMKKHRDSLL